MRCWAPGPVSLHKLKQKQLFASMHPSERQLALQPVRTQMYGNNLPEGLIILHYLKSGVPP